MDFQSEWSSFCFCLLALVETCFSKMLNCVKKTEITEKILVAQSFPKKAIERTPPPPYICNVCFSFQAPWFTRLVGVTNGLQAFWGHSSKIKAFLTNRNAITKAFTSRLQTVAAESFLHEFFPFHFNPLKAESVCFCVCVRVSPRIFQWDRHLRCWRKIGFIVRSEALCVSAWARRAGMFFQQIEDIFFRAKITVWSIFAFVCTLNTKQLSMRSNTWFIWSNVWKQSEYNI